jgi:hypothetical protein
MGSFRFVLLDDQRNVHAAMQTKAGETAILAVLQKNAPTVAAMLGVRRT